MKPEPVKVSELLDWMSEKFTVYASLQYGTRRLTLSVNPERIIRVEMLGIVKYEGGDEEWAAKLFNDLSNDIRPIRKN